MPSVAAFFIKSATAAATVEANNTKEDLVMPTGYTSIIGEGCDFKTFVMRCARGMGLWS